MNFLKPGGKVIVNNLEIAPSPVTSGLMEYPEVVGRIKQIAPDAVFIQGEKLALDAGNIRAVNLVLLGALSKFLPFTENLWMDAIKKRVPPKTLEINLKAFELGKKAVE